MQDVLLRLRYRYWPDHLLGEVLSKRWTETADPGHRPPDHHDPPEPGDSRLSVGRRPRRYRKAGGRNRLRRARHGAGRHRRRHRPFGRLDVRAVRLLRAVLPQRSRLASAGGDRRNAGLRRGARRRQRPPDRLSAAAGLHHHADHADHLSIGLRSSAVRLLEQDRGRVPRFPLLEFRRRRRGRGRAERRSGLSGRRGVRPYLPDPAAAGLACHRDRRLAPLGLQFGHSGAADDRAVLRRKRRA